MKKILFLAFIATVFFGANCYAQNTTPACIKDQYPDLFIGDYDPGETLGNGDVIKYVTHTVPFSKVRYLKGMMYEVTHPVPGNECMDMKSIVSDTDQEQLRGLVEMVQKYPRAIAKCEISIRQKYINGKLVKDWTVHTIGWPNNPESL